MMVVAMRLLVMVVMATMVLALIMVLPIFVVMLLVVTMVVAMGVWSNSLVVLVPEVGLFLILPAPRLAVGAVPASNK